MHVGVTIVAGTNPPSPMFRYGTPMVHVQKQPTLTLLTYQQETVEKTNCDMFSQRPAEKKDGAHGSHVSTESRSLRM